VMVAATDPANPYGSVVKWPETSDRLARVVGARVILVNGMLACYIGRGEKQLTLFLPDDEPTRSNVARAVATSLASLVTGGRRRALLIAEVNGEKVAKSALAPFLLEAGFTATSMGYQYRAEGRGARGEGPRA
jgi:ATP-dependent helicase Lhr and Lhr-like helicase